MAGERVRLEVRPREKRGSGEARRLRARGLIPGVLYGNGDAAQAFCIEERELRRVLTGDHGLHTILDVVIDGKRPRPAVLKDYQLHPTKGRLLHVDLHEVRLDQAIHAQVVVELDGEPDGVTQGGVLTQALREVTVEALPMDVPDRLHVDVSGLAIGDNVHASDISPPEGVKILDDPEAVVASVTTPTRVEMPEEMVSEEEVAAAEEVPAEEQPEGAAERPAEPEARGGTGSEGEPGTVPG